jgi:hypothetical protein
MSAFISASTKDTRFAAALGTLGVPVEVKVSLDERTGTRVTRFHLGVSAVDRKDWQSKKLMAAWTSGRLLAEMPAHPFCVCMLGFANRMALLDCANKGARLDHVRIPGTEVYAYRRGDTGLPGLPAAGAAALRTGDLKLATALATVGLPVVAIDGEPGRLRFTLPRYGPARADGLPRVDGLALMEAWRRNKEEIPWEDPFAQVSRALHNRERLLDVIHREVELVMIRKPRSMRSAVVRADATPAAWDAVKRHFDA